MIYSTIYCSCADIQAAVVLLFLFYFFYVHGRIIIG